MFITHGGHYSRQEAIFHNVPMIVFPLFDPIQVVFPLFDPIKVVFLLFDPIQVAFPSTSVLLHCNTNNIWETSVPMKFLVLLFVISVVLPTSNFYCFQNSIKCVLNKVKPARPYSLEGHVFDTNKT